MADIKKNIVAWPGTITRTSDVSSGAPEKKVQQTVEVACQTHPSLFNYKKVHYMK